MSASALMSRSVTSASRRAGQAKISPSVPIPNWALPAPTITIFVILDSTPVPAEETCRSLEGFALFPTNQHTWNRKKKEGNGAPSWGLFLAASGSAIGLGNIVFFSANAYKYGAGAFYVPYLLALLVLGIPVMIAELGLGHFTDRAFPQSMKVAAGKRGEFVGWWAVTNSAIICTYYVTILGWVVGMFVGAFGALWKKETALSGFAMDQLANPYGYFFALLSSWKTIVFILLVWGLNALICYTGAKGIEKAVRVFVPVMWLFMLVLIAQGLRLEGGLEGVKLLFTPDFSVMADVEVWKGAFSQIFFSLSLGMGILTAYASYLPKDADQVSNGVLISCMNCGFEYMAGLAIFTVLFAFSLLPKASTISMMFFIFPQGIASFGGVATLIFGVGFFALLLVAGLSSSVSLVEAVVASLRDKFSVPRGRLVILFCLVGSLVSCSFGLPQVIDPKLASGGTLGLTWLDLVDHWAFSYGLLLVGLAQCLLLGWGPGLEKLREAVNATSRLRLGTWYTVLIRYIAPLALAVVIVISLYHEVGKLYGNDMELGGFALLPYAALLFWVVVPAVVAACLTALPGKADERMARVEFEGSVVAGEDR